MKRIGAAVRLSVTAVLSAAVLLYGMVSLELEEIPAESSSLDAVISAADTADPEITASVSSGISESSVETESSETTVTAVQGSETVSGKIISRTINPASAAISADGVYMKNISGAEVNITEELKKGTDIKISKGETPQILLVHTHATESYMQEDRDYYTDEDSSRSTEESKNMVAIGEAVAERVRKAGYAVLHDKTLHDYPSYTGSYNASKKTIKEYLEKYPSVKIVIDIHRDAVSDGTDKIKLVKEINGRNAAQVMLVQGSQTGSVEGYPRWRENMRLSMLFHQSLESAYPGLARPILLTSKLYNQHLTNGSMLIEIGTDGNSMSEALYSAELVGNALATLLERLGAG